MLNGFFAKTYEEELPNENMFVSFMVDQEDVTPQLEKLGFYSLTDERQSILIDSLQNAMNDKVKRTDSTLHVNIDAFYEGNKFYATIATLQTCDSCLPSPSRWVSMVVRPTTGCGHVRLVTSLYSVFMPTRRPMVRQPIPRKMSPIIPNDGHK